MKKAFRIMTIGAAACTVIITAEELLVFHFGFRKAGDLLMKYWSEHNRTPEEAKELIRQGNKWLTEQDVREVSVQSFEGLTLRGHFLVNPDAKRTLIAFHGYRSNAYYDFGALVKFYYDQGCNVLLVEQRGHLISEGDYVDFGVLARRDVVTWTAFANDYFDKQYPLYLTGISMGAATILMAQDQGLPDNVCGMIADCGYSNTYREVGYFGSQFGITLTKYKMPVIDWLCEKRAGYRLTDANPVDALKKAKVPVLFIHGTEDPLVRPSDTEENSAACASEHKTVFIEGAVHAQSYFTDPERYEKEVEEFFLKYDPN